MTPEQHIKLQIIKIAFKWENETYILSPLSNIDDEYDKYQESFKYGDNIQDAENEVRGGDDETEIPSPDSRHYESKSVASKMDDGTWVGWTYWYGGGKWGEPEAMDWISDAYFLDCNETTKMVTVRSFSKV